MYNRESKRKGKKHLISLIELWEILNIIFLHSPLVTQCICYFAQLVSVFRRRSFSTALEVRWAPLPSLPHRKWICDLATPPFHPLANLPFTNGALSILSQHTTVNFHRFLPKKPALRHIVFRCCNIAKKRPCFCPPCCHSTEGRALYCKWLDSTGTVNTAQCASSSLTQLPRTLKIAFTFWFTHVLKHYCNYNKVCIFLLICILENTVNIPENVVWNIVLCQQFKAGHRQESMGSLPTNLCISSF
jgi:hypothetical protein